ncbi:DUF6629 family protein [Streptomyces sp. NPDC005263]|uniref:DUF6629 family protein n=1 Tax=Streptomyces sp. NPDC005263 TaxID=3364711 RepID=UPI0036B86842
MCWSATADLVAGTAVAGVGVACVARTRSGRELPLAALPLLLGAHQLVESVVWYSGGGSGPATTAWAVIALPLLTVWVPAGVLCACPPHARRRVCALLVVATLTAAMLAYGLATGPAKAEIRGHTVGYTFDLPLTPLLIVGYLLATVGSLLLSGDRWLRVLGILVALGALGCWVLWRLEFVSTWCALAAVCSVVVFRWVGTRPVSVPAERGPAARY